MKSMYELKNELKEANSTDRLELLQEQYRMVIELDTLKDLRSELNNYEDEKVNNIIKHKSKWLVKYYYELEAKLNKLSEDEALKELGI